VTTRTRTGVVLGTHGDLLEQPLIDHLATARPDGALQSNPVWFERDGRHLNIFRTKMRQKMRYLDRDPHVALSVTDPDNPYRYPEVRRRHRQGRR
jgi:PPOX class probable F420-dependent enzyme